MSLSLLTLDPPGADASVLVVSAPLVSLVAALLIPIANGLLTRWTLAGWIKGTITLAMNAVSAAFATALRDDGTAVFSYPTLWTLVTGFVVSVAIYHGIYKPAGLTSNAGGRLTPNRGIGPDPGHVTRAT